MAQPAEWRKRTPLRMIRGNKSAGEGSSLGLLEDFSIPPDFSFKEIAELDEALAKPQLEDEEKVGSLTRLSKSLYCSFSSPDTVNSAFRQVAGEAFSFT